METPSGNFGPNQSTINYAKLRDDGGFSMAAAIEGTRSRVGSARFSSVRKVAPV